MSHHPSSAELAAFRRAAYRGTPHGAIWGALPSERKLGIGNGPEIWNGAEDRWPSNVRREASAMRSRAFRRIFGEGTTWPEVTTFAPEPPYRCVNCGGVTCPEYGCATYNPTEVAHVTTRLNGFPHSIWPA